MAAPRLVAGLTNRELVDPIGSAVWDDTRLILADAAEGTRYRDNFTGAVIGDDAESGGAGLPLAEVFSVLPFAMLERLV